MWRKPGPGNSLQRWSWRPGGWLSQCLVLSDRDGIFRKMASPWLPPSREDLKYHSRPPHNLVGRSDMMGGQESFL